MESGSLHPTRSPFTSKKKIPIIARHRKKIISCNWEGEAEAPQWPIWREMFKLDIKKETKVQKLFTLQKKVNFFSKCDIWLLKIISPKNCAKDLYVIFYKHFYGHYVKKCKINRSWLAVFMNYFKTVTIWYQFGSENEIMVGSNSKDNMPIFEPLH